MSEPDAPVTSSVTAKLDKKKSIILGVIGLAVIVLIFWKVIPQIGSYEDALIALQNMGVGAMIVIGDLRRHLPAWPTDSRSWRPRRG